ncbi:hypothetical protein BGW80DRAFT_1462924 [Lactifluus volemus]|nr:hypothetical protein BGW80DRAFT_1462924 [Lactifluus volemus]
MFDVNQPATLHALNRWWSEFRTCAPLADEEFCLVVVINKTELISDSDNATTTMEEDALRLIDELVLSSDMRSTSRASGQGIILLDETSSRSGASPVRRRRRASSQLQLRDAHGGMLGSTHTRASPPSNPPHPPCPMAHAEPFESALSSPLSRSRSPSSSSPLLHVYKRPRTTRRRSVSSLTISVSTLPMITGCAIRYGASPSTSHATLSHRED